MYDNVLDSLLAEATHHHRAGREADAEKLYRMILGSPSIQATASYRLGVLCMTQSRVREAIEAYVNAIALSPDFVDAYINLGTLILEAGQPEEALALYERAVALAPNSGVAIGNVGKALHDLGRIDEATAKYREALAHQPDNAIVWANLGAALLEAKAWQDCVAATRQSIALNPNSAMSHVNLGTALLQLGRHDDALAACRQALALGPQGAAMLASLGGAMLELGALAEAILLCSQAVTLDPNRPDAHFNLSHALKAANHLPQAECAAREAIRLCPDSADYHFHLAHVLLLQGNLAAGWEEYEWRWKLPDFAWLRDIYGDFRQPVWAGEDITNKTIFIYTEQGIGDIVQFARYLPLVACRARRVIVAAFPQVSRLLQTIGNIEVVPLGKDHRPEFDVHCPLMTLPRAFATRPETIPAAVPYLRADPTAKQHWAKRLHAAAFRVGIVWAGNPATKRDCFRSPGLANVAPLFSIPGIEFVVLQMGPGRMELSAAPLPSHVIDLGAEIRNLTDTVAIMSGLDLMISSCTGPLHLAGALGIPTWAMIPFAPHFPWLLDRTDTAWYPSLRLYRQDQPGREWSGVMHRIAADLTTLTRSANF